MLREVAVRLPQPAKITAGGALVRAPGQDRIAFLAAVRNEALAPLWRVRNNVLSPRNVSKIRPCQLNEFSFNNLTTIFDCHQTPHSFSFSLIVTHLDDGLRMLLADAVILLWPVVCMIFHSIISDLNAKCMLCQTSSTWLLPRSRTRQIATC